MWVILIAAAIACIGQTEAGSCPSSHPYPYFSGDYCCGTGLEKVYGPQAEFCDGGPISYGSLCCENDGYVACEDSPCNGDIYTSTVEIKSSCPSSNPHVYFNGEYCCKTGLEKVYEPQGYKCDGSAIAFDSLCCEDDEWSKCTNPPCKAWAPTTGASSCPESHPYAYYNGDYCCLTEHEKVYEEQGYQCDGSAIAYDSLCCEGDQFIQCEESPCVSYDTPPVVATEPPTEGTTISAIQTDVICSVGQSDCYVYCEVNTPDELDTKGAELCKVKPDGSIGSCATMAYIKDDELFRKTISTSNASDKTYICTYEDQATVVIEITIA